MNVFRALKDFHNTYEIHHPDPWSTKHLIFRLNLIGEELSEVIEELSYELEPEYFHRKENIDKKNLTKELADLVYVVVGMADSLDLPLEEVFRRTHESNMTKNGGKREDGKLLKGDGYVPVVLDDLFYDYMPSESNND